MQNIFPALKRKDIVAQQIALNRISTPSNLILETSRPSSRTGDIGMFPIRPNTTSRPSTTMSRKGVQFVPQVISSQDDSVAVEPQYFCHDGTHGEESIYLKYFSKSFVKSQNIFSTAADSII